ncbi:MAG: PTS sugar transporter subunit IIA [Pseudomonadota bacterium]
MDVADLVAPGAVLASIKAAGKKQALQEVGHRAAEAYGLDCRSVIEGLADREKLGSTAMGGGVAIPHARIEGLSSIVGVFGRLCKPVDFEAPDGQGVDLMFVLLAPEGAGADHLRALAKVSRLLRSAATCEKLRQTDDSSVLYALLTEMTTSRAA